MAEGMLFHIQHFSVHDGPGIRTTVFFKGCNLHCFWCHNPESWSGKPQLQYIKERCIGCGACVSVCPNALEGYSARWTPACTLCGSCVSECYAEALQMIGRTYKVSEVMEEILRDREYYRSSGGGVTFSGGEPFLQGEFLKELLIACKKEGIKTAVESALCVKPEVIEYCLPYLDLFFCDVKVLDDQAHKQVTGVSNQMILENIRRISEFDKELVLRTPVIPGVNDTREAISQIAEFIARLPGKRSLELLPFRDLCIAKYRSLDQTFGAAGRTIPSDERMEGLAEIVRRHGVSCSINTPF